MYLLFIYLYFLFYFVRKLKLDVKNHNNLENKSKKIIQEEKQLKANIEHTNAQIKKLENSIKLEQKKVKF